MTVFRPFNPTLGANAVLSPGATSASANIDATSTSVRLVNVGSNICHVRFGSGDATTADTPIRAGSEIILYKAQDVNTLQHISALGTTLHVQTGAFGV
jgi:hypothetical protein